MSQATIERPVVAPAKRASSAAARTTSPREKILRQFSTLQDGIALMVEREQSDAVGRVLEHAEMILSRAKQSLASDDENDANASHADALEAESFIRAAGALVAQDFSVSDKGYKGRTMAADALVDQVDKLTAGLDRYLIDWRRSHPVGASAAPVAPTPIQSADKPDLDEINLNLTRVNGVLWMLTRCVGGEIHESERPSDINIVLCIQFINEALNRVGKEADGSLGDNFFEALGHASGIAGALDAMTWGDGQAIFGSDQVMSELYDAIRCCVVDAIAALNAVPNGAERSNIK